MVKENASIVYHEVDKCPNCGSKETAARRAVAWLPAGSIPTGTFVSLNKIILPLEVPKLAGLPIACIMAHMDACAKCGTYYSPRSEKVMMPPEAFGLQAQQLNRQERRAK